MPIVWLCRSKVGNFEKNGGVHVQSIIECYRDVTCSSWWGLVDWLDKFPERCGFYYWGRVQNDQIGLAYDPGLPQRGTRG